MTQELHGVISLGGTVIGGSLYQRGLKGETGDKGDNGDAATIAVGSTSTGAAGTNASVTNSGDEHDAVFDFTIPKGDKGETGDVNTYIAEYGTASYADIGDAITEGKYVIAVKDDNYYPLIMFSNSSYVFSYIHENICHEVVCDSYSTWTARTHTSVRDVKQNGASVTTSGVALVTTPQPTTTTPKMDGTAAVGSETTWAKGDHIHPSDTTKVDKEVGKGLSANDFTDSLKTKLEGVESGAEVNVQSDWNQSTNTEDDYIKNKPDLSVYAPLDSPSLTGTPTAPTATEGTNTTQIATTAFVKTGDDAVKEMIKNTLPTDTASGSIASFPDGSDLFDYLSCIVNIEPVQAGSGTPAPDNVRPITGWTGCNVVVSPTEDAQDGTVYPVSWQTEAGTVYGGTVDLVTGVLTVTWAFYEFDGTENWQVPSSLAYIYLTGLENSKGNGDTTQIANWLVGGGYQYQRYGAYRVQDNGAITVGNLNNNVPTDTHWSTDSFKQELSNTPLQVCYELATPQTYQLDPVQVACLLGQNNVWADCGDIEEVKYKADVQKWVEKQLIEINTAILALS